MSAVAGPIAPNPFSTLTINKVDPLPLTSVEILRMMLERGGVSERELDLVLSDLYGETLFKRVSDFLCKLRSKWPPNLERIHILEMLAALGHAVNLDDLSDYANQLKEKKIRAQILHLLPLDEAESLDDMPALIERFMNLLRNPLEFFEANPLEKSSLWDQLAAYPKLTDRRCLRYTSHEDAVYKLYERGKIDRPEFKFSHPELLAKHIGYAKPETISQGMVIPVFRSEFGREIIYYKLFSYFNSSGLHAYLFTPLNRPEMAAQLVFRGTNGIDSLRRDLDVSGIGKSGFDRNSDRLLQMVESYCKSVNYPEIEISGHSLGAADAQRAMALLVDQALENPQSSIASLREIKIFAFCSPKLDSPTVRKWDVNLQRLANLENPLRIELNFALHQSDFLTWTGDDNLHGAHASFINTSYLLAKSNSGVMSQVIHHTKPFFIDGNLDTQTDHRTFVLFQDLQYRKSIERMSELEERRYIPIAISSEDETENYSWEKVLKEEELSLVLTEEERRERDELRDLLTVLELSRAEIRPHQRGWAQHSWAIWVASWAIQPVKSIVSIAASVVKIKG